MASCGSRALAAASIWLVTAAGAAAQSPPGLPAAVVDAWKQYQQFAVGLSGSYTYRSGFDGKITTHELCELKCGRHGTVFTSRPASNKGRLRASGHTDRYSYELKQDAEFPQWAATEIASDGDWQTSTSYKAARVARRAGERAIKVYSVDSLLDLASKPYFRVVSASQAGADTYEIKFESRHAAAADPGVWVQSGSLTLDPARNYTLKVADLECESKSDKSRVKETVQVGGGPGEMPVPRVYEQRIMRAGSPDYVTTVTYDFEVNPPATDSDFRLTAFGLPEPADSLGGGPHVGWWFAGAAGLFAVGYMLRRAVRRSGVERGELAQ